MEEVSFGYREDNGENECSSRPLVSGFSNRIVCQTEPAYRWPQNTTKCPNGTEIPQDDCLATIHSYYDYYFNGDYISYDELSIIDGNAPCGCVIGNYERTGQWPSAYHEDVEDGGGNKCATNPSYRILCLNKPKSNDRIKYK